MRISPLLLTAAIMCSSLVPITSAQTPTRVAQRGGADEVSLLDRHARLEVVSIHLEDALLELARRSGVPLAFSPTRLPAKTQVSCACAAATVAEALDELLRNLNLGYSEISGQIVLFPVTRLDVIRPFDLGRTATYALYSNSSAETNSNAENANSVFLGPAAGYPVFIEGIAGTIVESGSGRPVEGAQIAIVGTGMGTLSDAEGRFRFANVNGDVVTLRIQRLGYRTTDERVRVGDTNVRITLEQSVIALDAVVVTGSVTESRIREMAVPVTVITAEEIERLQVRRVDQLFRGLVPGVVSLDQGNVGWYTNISVRGMNSFETASIKTYIDGIEVANPENVGMIDPNSIERIELIRGPQAATIYGADAIGGVLQIFTKKGGSTGLDRPRITLKSSVGTVDGDYAPDSRAPEQHHSLQLSGGGPAFSYSVGLSNDREGEWLRGMTDKQSGVSTGIQVVEGRFSGAASLRYSTRDYSFQTFPPFLAERFPSIATFKLPPRPLDFDQQTMGLNLGYQARPNWSHNFTLGFDRAEMSIVSGFDGPDDKSGSIDHRNQVRTSVRYHTSFEHDLSAAVKSTLTAGADYWRFDSDQFLTTAAPGTTLPGLIAVQNVQLNFDGWSNTGYFGQLKLGLRDRLFVTGALRAEDNPNFGEDYGMAWAPRIGAAYLQKVGGVETKLRASWGETIRPPQAGHRIGTPSGRTAPIQPNPGILPEEQTGWEGGIDLYLGNRLSFTATYYDQDVKNLIALVQDFEQNPPFFQYQNLGAVRNRGWEFETALHLANLHLQGSYAITSSKVSELGTGYDGDLRVGDENLDVPENVVGVSMRYDLLRGSASAQLSRVGRWTGFDVVAFYGYAFGGEPFRGSMQGYWTDYEPVTKLNLQLEQDVSPQWNLSVRGENVTNEQRSEFFGSMGVSRGRALFVGVRFTY